MNTFDQLIERNSRYANNFSHESLRGMPAFKTFVLTCLDARVDPAHFLDFEPGEVIVFRNLGGRVDDSVIESVAMLDTLANKIAGGGVSFEVAVIHHNDCGVSKFANPQLQQALAQRINRPVSDVQKLVIVDPNETAMADAELLASSNLVSPNVKATGYVYDVTTGRLKMAQVASPVEV